MKCYNSVFKITKSKLLKKNYSFIPYIRCKLIKIVRSKVIKGYFCERYENNLTTYKTHMMFITFHPYIILFIAISYNIILRTSFSYCEWYNPASWLISDPSEDYTPGGAIEYPTFITAIADTLISQPDGKEVMPFDNVTHQDSVSESSSSEESQSSTEFESEKGSESDSDHYFEPPQFDANFFVSDYHEYIRHNNSNEPDAIYVNTLEFIMENINPEIWSKNEEEFNSQENNIQYIVHQLDFIKSTFPENELKTLKATLFGYDNFQVMNMHGIDNFIKICKTYS